MTYKRFSYSTTQSVFTIVFKKKKEKKENKRIKINRIEKKYSRKEREQIIKSSKGARHKIDLYSQRETSWRRCRRFRDGS